MTDRLINALLALGLLALAIFASLTALGATGLLQEGPFGIARKAYWVLHGDLFQSFTTNPLFYIGFPAVFLAQMLRPAIAARRVSVGAVLTDVAYAVLHTLVTLLVLFVFFSLGEELLRPWITPVENALFVPMPTWLEIVIGYLAVELATWFAHMLRHRMRVLWSLHAVHHSQRDMNAFTLYRLHPLDMLASKVIIFFPILFFEHSMGIAASYLVFSRLHDALSHSNIRWNLGPLRYVFVTPQSHRAHHSSAPEFFDVNYGVTLSLWDRLFGTHAHSDFEYPETGIPDPDFPVESDVPVWKLPGRFLAQLVYPLGQIARIVIRGESWLMPVPERQTTGYFTRRRSARQFA